MKTENPFRKNQDVELFIDGMTNEGSGVGHKDGVAFFVPGTVVGETVEAHIVKVEKRYCIAKVVRIVEASDHRIQPRCGMYAQCGGCTLQHMDYAEQLKQKRLFVKDALERIGGLKDIQVLPVIGMDDPWRYRNKGSFPFGREEKETVFGFYAMRSHRLVPITDCPIQSGNIMRVVSAVCAWANRYHIPVYDEQTQQGSLRACMVRETSVGRIMAVVVTKGRLLFSKELIGELSFVDSLYHNRNDRDTNVVLGKEYKLLLGESVLYEQYDGLTFSISPESFLQVNYKQTQRLYKKAIECLNPQKNEVILDLYCGTGTISLQIAKYTKKVYGVEYVPGAIKNAKKNAMVNGLTNADFICGSTEDVLPELLNNGIKPDAIVLDPPRKGCDTAVLEAINRSKAKRIVYISCNPSTLGRDIGFFKENGFTIQTIQPVDMFPQTNHVETVVLMSRIQG